MEPVEYGVMRLKMWGFQGLLRNGVRECFVPKAPRQSTMCMKSGLKGDTTLHQFIVWSRSEPTCWFGSVRIILCARIRKSWPAYDKEER